MKQAVVAISVFVAATSLALLLRATPQKPADSPEMSKIYDADQKERDNAMNFTARQWQELSARDAVRRKQVKALIAEGALKTGSDFEKAANVFQHGDTPDDFLYAHVLAMSAMAKGYAEARWIAAATLDRYLQHQKLPQVFGTQYNWNEQNGKKVFTQEPYNRNFASDALRREFCVASEADQRRNLAAMKQGKDFPAPDGCR